jgi:hypothetical protein
MNAPRRDGADMLPRPHLRRPPLAEVVTYRLRVDLDRVVPPVWRMLEVRSDLTLDVLHRVLQVAYGWSDTHLHRFALGGDPFGFDSELFLCPYDVEHGEDEGTPEAQVRLDETVQERGDVLRYVYDYGDQWQLTLVLEEVVPSRTDGPRAICTTGSGSAPPEDSGGVRAGRVPGQRTSASAFDPDVVSRALLPLVPRQARGSVRS